MSSSPAAISHRVPRRLPASVRWGSLERLPHRDGGDDLRLTVFAPDDEVEARSKTEHLVLAGVGLAGVVYVLAAAVLQAWIPMLVAAVVMLAAAWCAVALRFRARRHSVQVEVWRVDLEATLADVRDRAKVIAIAHRLERAEGSLLAERLSQQEYVAIWRQEYTHVAGMRPRTW